MKRKYKKKNFKRQATMEEIYEYSKKIDDIFEPIRDKYNEKFMNESFLDVFLSELGLKKSVHEEYHEEWDEALKNLIGMN